MNGRYTLEMRERVLRMADEVLRAASVFSRGSSIGLIEMIRFIDVYRDRFGVECICRVLCPVVQGFLTARGYRATRGRIPSARRLREDLLVPENVQFHAENSGVYGRRKMHALLRRQRWKGWTIGRDQVERLMRLVGVRGVRESKRVFATRPEKTGLLPRTSSTGSSLPKHRGGSRYAA